MNRSIFKYNIIGIDPGTNTGVCIISIDDNYNILNVSLRTLDFNKYVSSDDKDDRTAEKLFYMDKYINKLLNNYDPICLSMEAAFVNNRFPSAGLSLAKYTAIIEVSVMKYNKNIYVNRYAPKFIKSTIGAGGKAVKDDMTEAVLRISELKPFIENANYTEHSIDATAIAYVTLEELRKDKILFTLNR